MAEMYILLTVAYLCYLGLSVSACGSQSNLQSTNCYRHHQQSAYQHKNQWGQNTIYGSKMISSKQYPQVPYENQLNYDAMIGSNIYIPKQYSHIPSTIEDLPPNVYVPPKSQYARQNFIHPCGNTLQNSHRCLRGVHSIPVNQQPIPVANKKTIQPLQDDFNVRNMLIKHRVRRNIDGNTEAPDDTTTESWDDFLKSLLTEMNSDEVEKSDDGKLPDRREVTADSNDSPDDDVSTSDISSGTSEEFFDRIRRQMPYFFQRLRSLRKLTNNPTSDEEMTINEQLEKRDDGIISVEEVNTAVITTEKLLGESKN